MKLNIMHKMFILVTLPIITLLLFSLNHIDDKYSKLQHYQSNTIKLKSIEYSSNLLHQLQLERGMSFHYLNNKEDYFKDRFSEQTKVTLKSAQTFRRYIKSLKKTNLSFTIHKHLETIDSLLTIIQELQEDIKNKSITAKETFALYTLTTTHLISLVNSFQIPSDSQELEAYIFGLKNTIELQEQAGQERAFVAKLGASHTITNKDMQHFHELLKNQALQTKKIMFLLENTFFNDSMETINIKYKNSILSIIRQEIYNHEKEQHIINDIYQILGFGGILQDLNAYIKTKNPKYFAALEKKRLKLDVLMQSYMKLSDKKDDAYHLSLELKNYFNTLTKENLDVDRKRLLYIFQTLKNHHMTIDYKAWFNTTTERINDFHTIEKNLLVEIFKEIDNDIIKAKNSIYKQIAITFVTIFLLLIGTFYIVRKIKVSMFQLKLGIDNFFLYLNQETNNAHFIDTQSNDEINEMAQSINTQMQHIEENLEKDTDFINETTQIVTLMKDGDFSERPYFTPHNKHLKELMKVFEQLTDLINEKIKEQTESLESLNASLEDRVHYQTLELEKQIQEITLSRDKAIQAEVAKDEFLANMSHEIRTPLNAILGFVTILKKTITDEKPLKYLNIIDTSGKSLLTIINDILDFSKIQSGKFIINPHPTDIIDTMSNTASLFAAKAHEKHQVLAFYIDPNMPKSIEIDSVRVIQIFSNLLSNAIKFTPEDGTIEINIQCVDSILSISIKDTGIGIAQEKIGKIFSPFEQADGSTTRKYGGTGLGLSISYKLAQLMKGTITLESQEGVGSTFTMTLPVDITNTERNIFIDEQKAKKLKVAILDNSIKQNKKGLIKKYLQNLGLVDIIELDSFSNDGYDLLFFTPDDEYNEEIVYSSKPSVALLRSSSIKLANLTHIHPLYLPYTPITIAQVIEASNVLNTSAHEEPTTIENHHIIEEEEIQFIGSVLVAEDNKTNQMLISLLLEDYGLQYTLVNDGVEAVNMFKKESYDIVLMDENMPELNGIGAMQQIKAYEKENNLNVTPIIALTASVLDTDKEKFLNAGMDGFVGKPIDNQELESELKRFLKVKE